MFEDWRSGTDYVPLLIFAAVVAWRLRSLDRARPLRIATLWVLPALVTALVGIGLAGMATGTRGWLAVIAGSLVGAAIGAQRARMTGLHLEGEGDAARVMMRTSPAAIILVLGVFGVRRLLMPGYHPTMGTHPGSPAVVVTDALLGLAVGMICTQRALLWRRARSLLAAQRAMRG